MSTATRPAPVAPARQDPAERRRALYHLASPVSVLTVAHAGVLHGTTASTVTLVSRVPLLIGVVLREGSSFARLATAEGRFAVNVLRAEQAGLARWFADGSRPDGGAQFADVAWTADSYAHAPLLAGALAHYTCRFHGVRRTGDGEVLLGYVVRATADEGAPLLSYAGGLFAATLTPVPAPVPKETAVS
ncbi:flavin reductase [Streptomyces sp. MUM 203J]|uniref:flavin reductase family protein n=1 Tax=Streptomyces sp. MUM 203J TaxID=2791990 RepID=UPI001F04DDBC|nr:flavin reductase family protein [Streptomyces sp. MUM 203J]MCH0540957.1 flavin reductase [Streptomyces sp. MUM 203J]